jgi:2-oxoglutarate ferredoxin oxidoreductase subunit delta
VAEAVEKKSKKEKKPVIEVNRDFCKGCGICVAFCPKEVLELDDHEKALVKRLEKCNACMLCELRCPDIAIEVRSEEQREEYRRQKKSRNDGMMEGNFSGRSSAVVGRMVRA